MGLEIWLWSFDFGAICQQVAAQVATFPELEGAKLDSYCDERQSVALLRLRCHGTDVERDRLTRWASGVGFRVNDATKWPPTRRGALLSALAAFEPQVRNRAMTIVLADLCACLVASSKRPLGPRTRLAHGTCPPHPPVEPGDDEIVVVSDPEGSRNSN